MIKTNVADIKARLSEYLDRALEGERIVICRHNTPIVELRPIDDVRVEPRPIGALPGRPAFDIPPSFFEPLPNEELDAWAGVAPPRRVVRPTGAASRAAHRQSAKGVARRRRR